MKRLLVFLLIGIGLIACTPDYSGVTAEHMKVLSQKHAHQKHLEMRGYFFQRIYDAANEGLFTVSVRLDREHQLPSGLLEELSARGFTAELKEQTSEFIIGKGQVTVNGYFLIISWEPYNDPRREKEAPR